MLNYLMQKLFIIFLLTTFTYTQCNFGDINSDGVEDEQPVIQILGDDMMYLSETDWGNYIDDGATCEVNYPPVVISQNVEVSGDVVNLSNPGVYNIYYNCVNSCYDYEDPDDPTTPFIEYEFNANTAVRTVTVLPACDLWEYEEEDQDCDGVCDYEDNCIGAYDDCGECISINTLFSDENLDGYDDLSFQAGTLTGDVNNDGILNVIDLVIYVNIIFEN